MVYPILYLLRRVLYTVAILFIIRVPFVGIIVLMITCVAMLAMIASESQWKDSLINLQHTVNEIAFYLVLLHVTIFCGLRTEIDVVAINIGWSLIVLILLTLVFNIAVILYMTLCYLRLYIIRLWNKKKAQLKLEQARKKQEAKKKE